MSLRAATQDSTESPSPGLGFVVPGDDEAMLNESAQGMGFCDTASHNNR